MIFFPAFFRFLITASTTQGFVFMPGIIWSHIAFIFTNMFFPLTCASQPVIAFVTASATPFFVSLFTFSIFTFICLFDF